MAEPPPLPVFRVSHQGRLHGPFPLQFLEAMVEAGHFSRDVQVMRSGGSEWVPLSSELPRSPAPKAQPRLVPDSKTVLMWIWTTGFVVAIVALIAALILSKTSKEKPRLSATRPVATPVSTPAQTPAPSRASASSSSTYSTPPRPIALPSPIAIPSRDVQPIRLPTAVSPSRVTAVPAETPRENSRTTTFTDHTGQTFSIPEHAMGTLNRLESDVEVLRGPMKAQEAALDELDREIESSRRSLNRSSQAAINAFNAKVDRYNRDGRALQSSIDRFNRAVDAYNTELRRVGRPIR